MKSAVLERERVPSQFRSKRRLALDTSAREARTPDEIPIALPLDAGWSVGNILVFSPDTGALSDAWPIQPKLRIGAADDPLEVEADRIADELMRVAAPEISIAAGPSQLSRKCAACEEAEEEEKKNVEKLQAKPAAAFQHPAVTPAIVDEALRSPGQPLDEATRAFFEPRFGHHFSHVRIHSNFDAAISAKAVSAHAYTVGSDIVFGSGRFAPQTQDGKRLLAHELAHVVQQSGGPSVQTNQLQRQDNGESVHPEEQHCDDLSKDSTATCEAIIDCINELIEQLADRFAQFKGDPGHLRRIQIVQRILETLRVLAAVECTNGEYDKELEEESLKWVNKKPVQQEEEQKKTLRERLPSVPTWVWAAIGVGAAALIVACLASGLCELGAIVTAVGEGIAWIIIAALRLAGVGLLAQAPEASPNGEQAQPPNNGAVSAVV